MYDELVNRLKILATLEVKNGESYLNVTAEATTAIREIAQEAADAIEELSREVDIDNDAMTAMYASMPRWIPVTERLPKTRKSILGKRSSKVIVAFRFDDGTQGTDTAHTLNGEWVFEDHITVVARTITHWMQLPKPPKEET